MQLIKKNKPIVILTLLAAIFFFIYSFLIFSNPGAHFTWPDETANYFFIDNFIKYSNFSVPEPLNSIAGDLIKPRSFNVYQGNLVPGSFLGMLLVYGLIGKIIGIGLVKYLTPLLATLSGLFFYKILQKIFDDKVAVISTLLFYVNPAWWYYANFAMLPNIPFLAFLLLGIYCLVLVDKNIKQNNILLVILGAFFVGLALIIRTNEFVWILGLLIIISIVYRQKINWQYLFLFALVCFLVFLPIFYYNQQTYGSFLSFGYLRLSSGDNLASQLPMEFKTTNSDYFNLIKFIIAPFGFNPVQILINLIKYCVRLFWWLAILAAIGLFIFLKKYQSKSQAIYFLIAFLASLYLAIYYGSWTFIDQLTLNLNNLGISYVRYFLPIYLFVLPFAAIALIYLTDLFKKRKIKILVGIFSTVLIIGFSLVTLYISGEDNLIRTSQILNSYQKINQRVLALTDSKAVIISQRSDKIFFPERRVIGRWDASSLDFWPVLLEGNIPLYYYAYESDSYIEDLNSALFYNGIELKDKTAITDKEYLYKIDWINYEDETE